MFIRLSKIANGLMFPGQDHVPSASQSSFMAVGLARQKHFWIKVRRYVAAGKSRHCTWPRPAIHDKTDSLTVALHGNAVTVGAALCRDRAAKQPRQ
ncbi:hypothetical protein, partial [Pseudomonas sp. S37]|uniref:hypothetical protein n=1 Tax=Pseudomonas sp. S37 TaxID=2767449 RepID=UPI001F3307CE